MTSGDVFHKIRFLVIDKVGMQPTDFPRAAFSISSKNQNMVPYSSLRVDVVDTACTRHSRSKLCSRCCRVAPLPVLRKEYNSSK